MFYSLQKAHNNHLVSCRYERAKLHITAYDAADAISYETAYATSHATWYVNVNLLKYSTSIVQFGLHSVYNSVGFPLFTTARAALRECSGMMCAACPSSDDVHAAHETRPAVLHLSLRSHFPVYIPFSRPRVHPSVPVCATPRSPVPAFAPASPRSHVHPRVPAFPCSPQHSYAISQFHYCNVTYYYQGVVITNTNVQVRYSTGIMDSSNIVS